MKHTVRILAVLAMVTAAAAVVSSRVPAHAVEGVESGYWWQGQPTGAPLPPPPNVPVNGLWISGSAAQPVAIAAVRFQLDSDETAPVLTAKVKNEVPPAQVTSAANAGQIDVLACPTTAAWKPAEAGAWSARPQYNCADAVHGTASSDGTTVSFDFSGVVNDSTVDVALVPGPGAAALPNLPVPGAPATPQPSGFDLTLQPVTADQVRTSPGGTSGAANGGVSTAAPATEALPSPAYATSPSGLGPVGVPASNFNYAATAVQPSSGTAASSAPSVAPGSLVPQARGIAASNIADNKGYRALAAILLGAMLWWAFRQAVPPRRHRRTIYDGPAPTPPAAHVASPAATAAKA
ncbi:MAG: hypothetical protein JOZ04_07105 [Acidimicrobiia bacterium]|nr:hypothetical protein [Acidimicrobiia bacterium]